MTHPGATILIVDDESQNRRLLEVLLRPEGYLTVSADSGEEALAIIAQCAPDLILLDVMMPGMDGHQVARVLKADPATARIPIIMVTAQIDRAARLAGLDSGAEDFLTKPVDRSELWLRVRNLLRLKEFGDFLLNHNLLLEHEVLARAGELQQFRSAMDATADAIVMVDRGSMRFVEVNATACTMLGYTREELFAMGPGRLGTVSLENLEREYDVIIAGHGTCDLQESKIRRKDGSQIQVEVRRHAHRLNTGWIIVGVVRDISERREAENRIAYLNRVYAVLSGINSLIVRTISRDALFREACQIAVEVGGFRAALIAIVDQSAMTIVAVASAGKEETFLSAIKNLLASPEQAQNSLAARAIREKVVIVSNDSISDPQALLGRQCAESGLRSLVVLPLIVAGEAVGVLELCAGEVDFFHEEELTLLTELAGDIAFAIDHIDKQDRLHYLAFNDVLTGLPNRALFLDRLEQGIKTARRKQALLAVLFVDLDHFKTVNDTLGHGIGDALLREVARRLSLCLRDTDTVGRLGGDEFAILLPEIDSSDDAALVAKKLIERCSRPSVIDGHELFISASVGVALFPDDAVESEILIRNADTAMYRAKELGRNTYQFFTAEMNQNTQEKLNLERGLRHALSRGEFLIHYQPKVSCTTGEITGFEALLRWQNPLRGLVGPDEFIPLLEENGLIVPVGEWVLTNACIQAQQWHDAGLGEPSMAVNISGRQIQLADLCETVRIALTTSGLTPAFLELELTESQLMKDAAGIIVLLKRLKAMGVKLSVDDFGTGFSSLAYLKRFPIDCLKVDRAFVTDIIADTDDVSITRAIITLAHSLKLKVVAEGVETEGQLGLLIANHCDEIQGYYFSQPLPAEEATALLHSGRSLDSRMMSSMKKKRTLLLVDDEASILSSLSRLLRKDGYTILTALSAKQGLELLAIHSVDVIVSDQRMPSMSGVDFLRKVKILHPKTVRLVLSGYTDLQAVTDAVNEGAIYKFLTKPWDDDILRTHIKEAFLKKEVADENLHAGSPTLGLDPGKLRRSGIAVTAIAQDHKPIRAIRKRIHQQPWPPRPGSFERRSDRRERWRKIYMVHRRRHFTGEAP